VTTAIERLGGHVADESSRRRVMDMLAGWAQYLSRCVESEDVEDRTPRDEYRDEFDAVFDLYQRVGTSDTFDYEAAIREIGNILCGGARR
jgi:hypothetical protein